MPTQNKNVFVIYTSTFKQKKTSKLFIKIIKSSDVTVIKEKFKLKKY